MAQCRKGPATFKGQALDPAQGTTDQGLVEKLSILQVRNVCCYSGYSQTHMLTTPRQFEATPGQTTVHWTRRDTEKHLQTILAFGIQPSDTPVSSKAGYELVGSYNWSSVGEGSEDVYYVPGKFAPQLNRSSLGVLTFPSYLTGAAPMWQDHTLPMQLPPDTRLPAMDSETAQDLPTYPYQASLEAIQIMKPGHSLDDVDILADWKVLRNLLTFVMGKQGPACRIKLYLVKKTLIIEMRSEVAETWCNGDRNDVRHQMWLITAKVWSLFSPSILRD